MSRGEAVSGHCAAPADRIALHAAAVTDYPNTILRTGTSVCTTAHCCSHLDPLSCVVHRKTVERRSWQLARYLRVVRAVSPGFFSPASSFRIWGSQIGEGERRGAVELLAPPAKKLLRQKPVPPVALQTPHSQTFPFFFEQSWISMKPQSGWVRTWINQYCRSLCDSFGALLQVKRTVQD